MSPKFTSCHKAIMVVAGRAHCIIIVQLDNWIVVYIYFFFKICKVFKVLNCWR